MVDMIEYARQFEIAVRMMHVADDNASRAASSSLARACRQSCRSREMESLVGSKDRARGAADAHGRRSRRISRTSTRRASSAVARSSRTCCTRTSRRSAATSQQTDAPTGLNLGTGVRVVATEKQFTQGNLHHDEQPARYRDSRAAASSRSCCPTARRPTRATARSSSIPSGQIVTSSGYAAAAVDHRSEQRADHHGRRRRRRERGRCRVRATPVQVGTVQLTDFVNPAGLAAARREPV